MTPKGRVEADDYLDRSRSWATGEIDDLRRSRRIAWTVALIATAAVAIQSVAILWLFPLKTVVPYTLLVDRQTGYVQSLDPLEVQSISPDRALTQSFLVQYVLAREGFDRVSLQQSYRKALLWSAEGARTEYATLMPATNPQSPLVRLPFGTTIEARVRSVSPLNDRSALVRFETFERDRGGTMRPAQPWVAVVEFRFSRAPLSVEDRFLNPLGFQVTRYRRSAEAPMSGFEDPLTSQSVSSGRQGPPSVAGDARSTGAPAPPRAGGVRP
jgi:type IV secretion system protein VirB8